MYAVLTSDRWMTVLCRDGIYSARNIQRMRLVPALGYNWFVLRQALIYEIIHQSRP